MSEFEHGNQSPWGYIYDAETLPDLMTLHDFAVFTNGRFDLGDTRVPANIASASEAIRNYCGWHISPSLDCGMLYNVHDLRDAFVGNDLLIQLPATFVTNVEKVVLGAVWNTETGDWDGEVITDPARIEYTNGLLRVFDAGRLDRRARVFVKYTAGFPDAAVPLIKELVANSVVHAITNTYGVASETAGGNSVSYSAAWADRGSTALTNDTRDTLSKYKVREVF